MNLSMFTQNLCKFGALKHERNMEQFKVNDKVYCLLRGEGKVVSIEKDNFSRFSKVAVIFTRFRRDIIWYTQDGVLHGRNDWNQTLFPEESKMAKFHKRYFANQEGEIAK